MRPHQLCVAEALTNLVSAPEGLSFAEAQRRLREYGPNQIAEVRRKPVFLRLVQEFIHFFSLVLWVAALLAFVMERITPGQGMARLGIVIVLVIVVSGLFSFLQEFRAERALDALRKLLPQQVQVLRQGKTVELPAEQLVPGDVIVLDAGANVPADCRLIEAFGVRVNNATVTGESLPLARNAEPSRAEEPIDASNVLLAGTALVFGRAKAVVFATGTRTEFGAIAHLTQAAGQPVSPLRKEIARLSRTIILLAIAIGILFFALGQLIGVPPREDLIFTVGIIVAMVPEGLLPTLTLALVLAGKRLAKRNVLIRHLPAVEAVGSVTVICTDKTGTLTQNRMSARMLLLGSTERIDSPAALRPGDALAQRYRPFFLAAGLCHDLAVSDSGGRQVWLGDPMEIALAELARGALGEAPAWRKVDEIPFDAERMRLSTVFETPEGKSVYCKGAPETVLPLCDRILAEGAVQAFSEAMRAQVIEAQDAMAGRGLRVLAFAYRPPAVEPQPIEQALVLAGLVGLEDPPRPEVPDAIRKCREAGIKVIMVTGDHQRTAVAVGREIALVQSESPVVVHGERLRRMSDTQLQLVLDAPEIIFARVGADQKMRIVEALKQKREVVAVTGDGVNDAPALKSAHVGIAMGIGGTAVAKAAADMVLLDDNFASIVSAVEEGRAVFDNIRKFLTYILTHNMAELVPYLGFVLFRIPLALTPIQMLAIDLGTDSLSALGLGSEPPEPRIMSRPPRPLHEPLLGWSVSLRAYLLLGPMEAAAALAAFFFVLQAAGWRYGESLASGNPIYLRATTACLAAIVVMQIMNAFLCRSSTRSVFSTGFLGNRLVLWGGVFGLAVILPIIYLPLGSAIFGTAPIGPYVWLFILPFTLLILLADEVHKWFARAHSRRASATASSQAPPGRNHGRPTV
jgi:sodium/potassium-transporting ATPase subunit alpha